MSDVKDFNEVQEVKVEDNVKEEEGLFATDADYDSGWRYDSTTMGPVLFEHKLGCIPTRITLLFTADKKTVFPVIWHAYMKWGHDHIVGRPVDIRMDNKSIQLKKHYNHLLHYDIPYGYLSGYWRVFAWK